MTVSSEAGEQVQGVSAVECVALEAYQNTVWGSFPNTVIELFVVETFSGPLFCYTENRPVGRSSYVG